MDLTVDDLTVDMGRLRADLEALGAIGRHEGGGISRTSFSAADLAAREWYRTRCVEAGLRHTVDPIGNVFADLPTASPVATAEAAVWSGSHIDTVPDGGAFDGAVGAVAALECVRRLAETRTALRRPVRAVAFADEEGNYAHLLGSSALARGFTGAELAAMTGRDGDRLLDTLGALGWDVGALTRTRVDPGSVHRFVELHIEQGPRLEAAGVEIGVVSSIVGLGGATVTFRGRADHAGTTPMTMRQDPLLAAAAYLVAIPGVAASVSDAAVTTCGRIGARPGGTNVVPGSVTLSLDFREPGLAGLTTLADRLAAAAHAAAAAHDVSVDWQPDEVVDPVALDPQVQQVIADQATRLGFSTTSIPSGAGHDSQNLATIAPTGMIFVQSKGGHSHSPREESDWAEIEKGANVLLGTLVALANA